MYVSRVVIESFLGPAFLGKVGKRRKKRKGYALFTYRIYTAFVYTLKRVLLREVRTCDLNGRHIRRDEYESRLRVKYIQVE